MKKILHVEIDESDYFFNEEDGKFLHSWCKNDANYRSEYMLPLFKKLGIDIIEINPNRYKSIKEYIMKDLSQSYGQEDIDYFFDEYE